MNLNDITSYAEIRGVLGVDEDELADAQLVLEVYSVGLKLEFREIGTTLLADFETVKDIEEGSRTALQADFYDAVRAFAPYAVGVQLFSTLPLGAPKSITDGKAGVTRDAGSPYKVTIERVTQMYTRFRTILGDAYAAFKSTTVAVESRPFFLAVTATSDPVEGT